MAYSIITTEAHVIRAMAACGGLYGLLDYRPGRANLKRIWRRCRCWGLGTGRLHWRLLGCIGSILLLLGRRSWLLLHRLLGWCRHWTRGRAGPLRLQQLAERFAVDHWSRGLGNAVLVGNDVGLRWLYALQVLGQSQERSLLMRRVGRKYDHPTRQPFRRRSDHGKDYGVQDD